MQGAWEDDPWRRYAYRWRDHTGWTEHVADGSDEFLDPPGDRRGRLVRRAVAVQADELPHRYRARRGWWYGVVGLVVVAALVRSYGDGADAGPTPSPSPSTSTGAADGTGDTTSAMADPDPTQSGTSNAERDTERDTERAPVSATIADEASLGIRPELQALLPHADEVPSGWTILPSTPDERDPGCLDAAFASGLDGLADHDMARASYSDSGAGPAVDPTKPAAEWSFAIAQHDVDLMAIAQRVRACSGVTDTDGATHQVSDLEFASLGDGSYAFRDEVDSASPLTVLGVVVVANGYVITGVHIAAAGAHDLASLESMMTLILSRP